ncbi:hypothetical protein QR685DRAFT_572091 [Neurospora intermedia]|uniref:Uncharacterized protein n=1 Tax=Neurospora intermedia TaxID=5142 RepID=A0ABR3DEH5_NEUIN
MRRSEQRRVRLRADDNIQLETSVLPNFQLSPTAPSGGQKQIFEFVACVCTRLLHSSVKVGTNGAIGYCLACFTGRPPGLVGCHVQDCVSGFAFAKKGLGKHGVKFEVASQIEIDLLPTDRSSSGRGIPLRPSGCTTKRRYAAVLWLEPERLKTRTVALPDPQNVETVTYQVWSEALIAVMSVCLCVPFSSILSRFACSDSK